MWLNAPVEARVPALVHLAARLAVQRPGLQFLLTTHDGPGSRHLPSPDIRWQPLPSENPAETAAFISHWRPDLCLWSHGNLRPSLIAAAVDRGVPIHLVDAAPEGFDDRAVRWFPDLARATLGGFRTIHAINAGTQRRLQRIAPRQTEIRLSGAMQDGGAPPPCRESDLEFLSELLAGRPVWLAAHVTMAELPLVLAAHRAAQRASHRLLLVLVPQDPQDSRAMSAALDGENLRHANWTDGGKPTETVQVLLADDPAELGLWYRVAPLSLIGNSLVSGATGRDPYPAASLGSAILCGPFTSGHQSAYARLAAAGAARVARDEATLAAAVSRLISPDQAAAMAMAAWEVTSDGAEVTDRMIEIVLDTLDLGVAR